MRHHAREQRYEMFEYEQGYFKALLDIIDFTNQYSINLKSMKQRKFTLLINLIKYLSTNRDKRDLFMKYGGSVGVKVSDDKDCKIVNVFDKFK